MTAPDAKPRYITPGVVIDGRVYYPTCLEWLIGFHLAGCEWATEALERWDAADAERWAGSGI